MAAPRNIEFLQQAYRTKWLENEWQLVQYLSKTPGHVLNITSRRLHPIDAQELLTQGHDPIVLAWASRPDCVNGHISKLKNKELRIYPYGVEKKPNDWSILNTKPESVDAIKIWDTSIWDANTQSWIKHTGGEPKYWCSEDIGETIIDLLTAFAEHEGITIHKVDHKTLQKVRPYSTFISLNKELRTYIHDRLCSTSIEQPQSIEQFYIQLTEPGMNYAKWVSLTCNLNNRYERYDDHGDFNTLDELNSEVKKRIAEIDVLPHIKIDKYPVLSTLSPNNKLFDSHQFVDALKQYIENVNKQLGLNVIAGPSLSA